MHKLRLRWAEFLMFGGLGLSAGILPAILVQIHALLRPNPPYAYYDY